MKVLNKILDELDELYIVKNITKKHYEARNKFSDREMTVPDDTEFDNMIAEYYNYQYSRCISGGSDLPRSISAGEAKKRIERKYKSKGLDMLNAYYDGKNGENGGMFGIYDIISNALIEEAKEHHIRDVIARFIQPSNFDEKVAIIKEIFKWIGPEKHYIDYDHPERYVHNYEELIKIIAESMKKQDNIFRRL